MKKTKYLVKWKLLPYEECTWEDEDDLTSEEDLAKIDAYDGTSTYLFSCCFLILQSDSEAAALKRSKIKSKLVKFNKEMEPPKFLGSRELKDFQKVLYCAIKCETNILTGGIFVAIILLASKTKFFARR